jgi:hypothetical protein
MTGMHRPPRMRSHMALAISLETALKIMRPDHR